MDHIQDTPSHHPFAAIVKVCLSIVSTVGAIKLAEFSQLCSIGAAIIAMVSGIMAARYYYYETKRKNAQHRSYTINKK
jgi:thiamine monophosphate synthase